jgi:Ca2+-binding EF-hand superfamily protein
MIPRLCLVQFDKNKDGRITKDEMSANPFLFERMDANKDGIVTAAELSAYEQAKDAPTRPAPAATNIRSCGCDYTRASRPDEDVRPRIAV